MKHSARDKWAVDITIVSDDALGSQQIVWCTRKLYQAVTANGNCGGVKSYIGDEYFHEIDVWADKNCDWGLLIQVISEMCRAGCYVEVNDDDPKRRDCLGNLGWHLSRVQ